MSYFRCNTPSGGGGGTQVAQGTFSVESRTYLYHDIPDTPDSVYEIPHGLDHTPTFFFMWEDGTGGMSGNTQFTYGFFLPNEMRSYVANYKSGMGTPSSSTSQNMTFRPFGDASIAVDSTKITLKGSSSNTTYFLAGNSTYHWIAF